MIPFVYKLLYQGISLVVIVFSVPTIPPYSHQLSLGNVLFPLGVVLAGNGYIPIAICCLKKGFRKQFLTLFINLWIQVINQIVITFTSEGDTIHIMV